ncbi:MAG: CHAT domain-containing protein, partial [Planctomycetota bacterium]
RAASALELARRRDALERAFTRVLDGWKRGRVRAGGLGLFYFGDQRFVLSELVALELALDASETGRERALDAWMRAQSVGSLSRALDLAEVSLDEVRGALLAPGTGLLVYLPAPQSSYVFAVDGSGIVSAPLAADSELDARRRAVSEWLSVSPVALTGEGEREERARALAASIDALSRALLPDAIDARVRGWTSVIVVGADVLGSAPFECLTTADGRVLGLDFALSHLPSLQVGVHLARACDARPRERDVCVFAASQADPDLRAQFGIAGDFVFGDAERERVASPFASERVSFVSASDATVDRLLVEPFERTAVLSIFAHGVYDLERERPAGLLLAARVGRSSVLWSDDVERGRWPPLVVLLACGAARGPMRPGDDVGGHLGHAFFAGGASAVVLNSFDMPYGGALTLASAMHRELAQEHGAAEALRRARRALASEPATNDPHFYGSLRLLGLGVTRVGAAPALPQARASDTRPITWLVVGVVLCACAVGLRRSRLPRSSGR